EQRHPWNGQGSVRLLARNVLMREEPGYGFDWENRIGRPDSQAIRKEPQRKRRTGEYHAGCDPRCPQGGGGSAPRGFWIVWRKDGCGTNGRESPDPCQDKHPGEEAGAFLRGQGPVGSGDRTRCQLEPQRVQDGWRSFQQPLPKQERSFQKG